MTSIRFSVLLNFMNNSQGPSEDDPVDFERHNFSTKLQVPQHVAAKKKTPKKELPVSGDFVLFFVLFL